jgi:energy-coupling factor transport system ATP-binding protein
VRPVGATSSAGSPAPGSSPPAVEADGLGWTYTGRSTPAIEGLTFRLEPGRVLLVLGPSGSGKSTLARALAGLVPHVLPGTMSGRLSVGGLDVAKTPARLMGERVGLVFQDPDSQLVMSRVDDEVAFGLENRGVALDEMRRRVPEVLAEVGLAGFEARGTMTLSGGEKQRLAIADVLAAGPGLLVLDEPTANLDPPGMHSTFERLAELARRREHTIVLIEHRLEAALPLADDVLLIDDAGRQLAFERADRVGREAIEMLERSGAWLPRAWQRGVVRSPGSGAGAAPERRGGGSAVRGARPRSGAGSDTVALAADGVRVEYALDESGMHVALDGVRLSVAPGERVALVGPNGAGKSSLLFALAGLLRPKSGSVRVGGGGSDPAGRGDMRDPARLPPRELAAAVGLVFQDPELGFVASTARDEVAVTARATGKHDATGDATGEVLAHFGLGRLAAEDPFRLSQGEQRRLSLAALALRPPAALLLDEPTFGLDRRGTDAVLALLDDLRDAGQAQVLATHDPRLLPACDRVVALDRGRVVFDGPVATFLAAPPFDPAEPWLDGAQAPNAASAGRWAAVDEPGPAAPAKAAAPATPPEREHGL